MLTRRDFLISVVTASGVAVAPNSFGFSKQEAKLADHYIAYEVGYVLLKRPQDKPFFNLEILGEQKILTPPEFCIEARPMPFESRIEEATDGIIDALQRSIRSTAYTCYKATKKSPMVFVTYRSELEHSSSIRDGVFVDDLEVWQQPSFGKSKSPILRLVTSICAA